MHNSVPSAAKREKGYLRKDAPPMDTTTITPGPMPSMRLDGKIAVVTGAGRGIGRGCAQALAEAGAKVHPVSRTASELEEVCRVIRDNGGEAEPLICDVTALGEVSEKLGGLDRIDVLVNNAGTNIPEPFLEVPEEHFDRIVDLNIKSAFFVAQAGARKMDAGGGGSIINISSQMGHVGAVNRTVYCLSKFAVEGMTKAMAVELAPRNIRVNTVCPTFIRTPMTEKFFADESFIDSVTAQIPLGRVGGIEDIMGAVVFLASPAAALITGASLLVDGGWTAK
jgi:NAD(P)-dependent dehydrogenase (short-subunit alcohol dehydrogenase family)